MTKWLILSVGLVLGLGSMAEAASITSDTRPTVGQSLVQHIIHEHWVQCGDACDNPCPEKPGASQQGCPKFTGKQPPRVSPDGPGKGKWTGDCRGDPNGNYACSWVCFTSCHPSGPSPD
jgi:hypothetical protein